jgi:Mn-dependent DtxR family transcriptional regulator
VTGRTVSKLARRIGVDEATAAEFLHDFAVRGIAFSEDGEWRLTEFGEVRYGRALRDLEVLEVEDDSKSAKSAPMGLAA